MAASDQPYRSQYALDVVFAVSSILMLVSLIGMFIQDYNREFKHEQRRFRDVESAIAQRLALEQIPPQTELARAEEAVEKARGERKGNEDTINSLRREIAGFLPSKEKQEVRFQTINADLASRRSFYNIEVENNGPQSDLANRYRKEVQQLSDALAEVQSKRDDDVAKIKERQRKIDDLEEPLTVAVSNLKKVNDKFDTQVKLAISKQWGMGDFIRNLPVIDGFAAPTKIHQFTLNDIPIDYNFKYVTRFDRCVTCHQGIDRPAYTKENLTALTAVTPTQEAKLQDARKVLEKRKETLKGLDDARNVPAPDQLKLTTLPDSHLTAARIREFAAHPRLDLFVGANSKHPSEKFGCTSCHRGQGSGTSFLLSSHTPNDSETKERWIRDYSWHYDAHHGDALWDFPMLPLRFIESSCLKCHHEVTDLIGSNNRNEAPQVVRGFNLIKENGCFGCHEIQGRQAGRQIGPDLRLEASPPLEDLPPAERAKIEADPDNMPGNLRKVGPSLFRLSEKTNRDWTAKWLRKPREFRPDTKMPHFYELANNNEQALKGTGQEKFPEAETAAITHFLFGQSDSYLKRVADSHKADAADRAKDQARLEELKALVQLTEAEKKELDAVAVRVKLRAVPLLATAALEGNKDNGRLLFTQRGCMACHSHQGTETAQGSAQKIETYAPAVMGEANFGPNLSQVAAKLVAKPGDKKSEAAARNWLVQWIKDPQIHSPRSRMPVTHLDNQEAADIAAWLLSQPATDLGDQWKELTVPDEEKLIKEDDSFRKLAQVYLVRILSARDIKDLEEGKFPAERVKDLPQDEQVLATSKYEINALKSYLGKKAVARLGCYACHDIPGFDNAKPIGVGLNDWGKKDPERLAFEDIAAFLKNHYEVVDNLRDKDGKPVRATDPGKPIYERFFAKALLNHSREGFLHQKIKEPRSFDYQRILAWDDRSRMPQFRFARTKPRVKKAEDDGAVVRETPEEYEARATVEEAEAREAVMTFVLGLVAEPVPIKSINQPSGDRLAEVRGRQVLDKYNCAGCHLIRPGVFEFQANKEVTDALAETYKINKDTLSYKGDHVFPYHHNWAGKTPTGDRLMAHGVRARVDTDEDNPAVKWLRLSLTQALRFRGPDMHDHDLRSSVEIRLPPDSMVYPPADIARSDERLQAFQREQGPYGGAFADLLANFLMDRLPKQYDRNPVTKDNGAARASVPPILLGQGERTQSEWLYQFLLNPTQVRRMTVLRMPRFNMSKEEAKALVNYFSAVERLTNTGLGVNYPYEAIPQQEDLSSPFWQNLTAQYVDRLKTSKVKDGGKDRTLFDQRVEELQPVWKQIKEQVGKQRDQTKSQWEAVKSKLDEVKKLVENEKDAGKKAVLDESLKDVAQAEANWKAELDRLEKLAARGDVAEQQKTWEKQEAYVTDGYRLLANYQLCLACHQIGPFLPNKLNEQGPALDLSADRLQPGWLQRWLAHPQRYVTYSSVMPTNFPAGKESYQQWFAGSPLEQVTAVRDVLMIFPRASAMPINRYWTLPPPGDKK